jgi:hypothetical protein
MGTHRSRRASMRAAVVASLFSLVVAAGLVEACSSGNSNPVPPVYTITEAGADSGDSSPAGDVSSGQDSAAPPPGDSSVPDSANDSAETSVDAASCGADGGCWNCTPATAQEFLNQCTSSQCTPFDNLQRLPDWDGGALPPLQ